MQVTMSSNSITIAGNIKSVNDYQDIKTSINDLVNNHKTINIIIQDSLSITSSVIGYLNKLVLKDGIKINMKIGDTQLMELLDDLNLTSVFSARKI